MKTIPKKKISLVSFCYPLCIAIGMSAAATAYAGNPSAESNHITRYLVLVTKAQNNKKHNVRLYSNDRQDELLFTVSGPEGKNYQLFVFDMDGKLVCQAKIQNRETSIINRILKGNYFFEVFSNDEQVESGQLRVK
jgi:hypothetical protein